MTGSTTVTSQEHQGFEPPAEAGRGGEEFFPIDTLTSTLLVLTEWNNVLVVLSHLVYGITATPENQIQVCWN